MPNETFAALTNAVPPGRPLMAFARAVLEARGTPFTDFLREVKHPEWQVLDVLAGEVRIAPCMAQRVAFLLDCSQEDVLRLDQEHADARACEAARLSAEPAERLLRLVEAWAGRTLEVPSCVTRAEVLTLVQRLVEVVAEPPRPRGLTPPVVSALA